MIGKFLEDVNFNRLATSRTQSVHLQLNRWFFPDIGVEHLVLIARFIP